MHTLRLKYIENDALLHQCWTNRNVATTIERQYRYSMSMCEEVASYHKGMISLHI